MLSYVTLTLSLICLTLIVANAALFEFTVICMKDDDHNLRFSSYEQGLLLGVIAVGCMFGTYPSIKLFDTIGFNNCFTLMGLLSAIGTLIVPFFGHNFYVILLDQLVQGIALAAAFLALGVIPAVVGDYNQKGFFASILTCSMQLGPFMAGSYVLFAILTLVAFILFFFVYGRFTERKRSCLIKGSYPDITALQDENANDKGHSVPYRSIFTSASFWGLMFVDFGDTCGYQLFMFYGPTYLNKVLSYEVRETGFFAALPHLLSMATKTAGGFLLDRATCVGEGTRATLFIAVSEVVMMFCFAVLSFVTAGMAFVGQAMLNVLTVFSGLAFIGLVSGSQIVGQQYTYVLTTAIAVQDSLAGLVVPAMVALIAPNYEEAEWRTVFLYLTAMLMVTVSLFLALTRMKPARWTMTQLK
ncbi:hypothetical protein QR680_010132 [Steinernema hermaphroditum]|uniref:Major facilitator superfamily (MFS) profile domain-containing protein n=1 Tax=Steinernema hermaphroditum TaxID=289476 RepID=A0AA39MB02_9BILA|nr:hypothetical protein QR680_010132 [Steinernema hermaphroditum]